jgi:hypothetical protein
VGDSGAVFGTEDQPDRYSIVAREALKFEVELTDRPAPAKCFILTVPPGFQGGCLANGIALPWRGRIGCETDAVWLT